MPAAGSGSRVQADLPKQYLSLRDTPILVHSLQRLLAIGAIQRIVVTLAGNDQHWSELGIEDDRVRTCTGGPMRQDSVLNGLIKLSAEAGDDDWVLVHDAARPCVRVSDIEKLIAAVTQHEVGGLLGWPVDNTLKRVDENGNVLETIERENCWNAATPQMFPMGMLKEALSNSEGNNLTFTDEASAIQSLGYTPIMVEGARDNIKITHVQDFYLAGAILDRQGSLT